MEKTVISERLRALASDSKNRSKASQLLEIIDDVEAAMAAGVSRSVIIDELSKHGLEFTLPTFKETLLRIRKKRKANDDMINNQKNVDSKNISKPLLKQDQADKNSSFGSSDPRELDKIFNNKPDLEAYSKLYKMRRKLK